MMVSGIMLKLTGVEENSVDLLAFETLIPKNIIDRYISLLVEHRRLIICGPTGTGKTFLAARLAEHIVQMLVQPALVLFYFPYNEW
jgi:neuron navigator 2